MNVIPRIVCSLIGLFLLLSTSVSRADAHLLAQYREFSRISDFPTSCSPSCLEAGFGIGAWGGVWPWSTTWDPSSAYLFSSWSAAFYVPIGTTGEFDFDQSNAAGFTSLVSLLTDELDGHLVAVMFGVIYGDRIPESYNLGGGLLTGRTIDFIRLVVDEYSLSTTDRGPILLQRARWQFWGSGEPLPSAISEPTDIELIAIALAAAVCFRRLGCRV